MKSNEKKRKRLFGLLMSVCLMTASLAGCGSSPHASDAAADQGESAGQTQEQTQEQAW